MATDIIARGLAVSNSGSGGGSTSVDIQDGVGIEFTGSDPIIINNGGITNVQTGNDNGTIRVTYGKDSKTKSVPVKGLDNAAYKNVDTVIDETTKDSENLPTTKAVKKVLDSKIDSGKLGEANGIATLDEYKKLVSDQLPSHNHGSNEIDAMTNYQKPSTLAEKEIKETDSLNTAIGKLEKNLDDKMDDGNYAGSSTKGGSATSAEKLSNTEQIGTNKKPVYFSADGVPVAIDHTINSDVPENAKFTDTKYSAGTGIRVTDDTIYNMGVLSVSESTTNGCVDFTVGKNGTETSESKTIPVHGIGDAAYKSVDTVVTKDSANLITSGAVSTELDKKMNSSMRNSADGVAGLDSNSKINVSQIPTTDEYNVESAYPVTGKAIEAAMNTLPNPMLYKGSLGEGGTITALPTASASNEGFTYKVITSGAYAGQSAKVGDVFISNGTEWTIIPSGDEPEGTVISVGMSVPTGLKIKDGTSPVTTSGTIEVQLDEGYVIPKEADIVPSTRKINNITLESDVVLDGDDIKATGYVKAGSKSNITGTDTINQALGKLELKSDTNETNILTLAKHVNGDLLDSDFQEDNTVAMSKTVPTGMADYTAIKKIGGRTQKMVQLVSEDLASVHNVTLDSSSSKYSYAIAYRKGHVYMMSAKSNTYPIRFQVDSKYGICKIEVDSNARYLTKFTCNYPDFSSGAFIYNTSSSSYTVTGNFLIFDLTEMGIPDITETEFRAMFPEDYYPYTEGELWNTPVESVVSVGKNLCSGLKYGKGINTTNGTEYDLANAACTDFIPVKPSTTIYASGMGTVAANFIAWYDANKNYIDRSGGSSNNLRSQALPANARYVRLNWYGGVTLDMATNNTIMISYDKSAFIPYNKTTLLIPDSDRNLPCFGYGINETVQNIRDYENGAYTQMVAEVDLGDLSWVRNGDNGNRFYCDISTMKASSSITNGICLLYNRNPVDWKSLNDKDFCLGQNINSKGANIAIRDDSYTDATTFKTAMKGVKLVYELATPVVTDCSDILHPIRCESGGTITLQNEHNLDMPNSIMYKKEVSLS